MRGFYTFADDKGNNITLRFNTWTGVRFCQIQGVEFENYLEFLKKGMTVERFASLLLCAHESYCKSEKITMVVDDYDATCWIDAMGGLGSDGMAKMIQAIKEGNEPPGEPDKGKKKASR